jgi:hypothetical protein
MCSGCIKPSYFPGREGPVAALRPCVATGTAGGRSEGGERIKDRSRILYKLDFIQSLGWMKDSKFDPQQNQRRHKY